MSPQRVLQVKNYLRSVPGQNVPEETPEEELLRRYGLQVGQLMLWECPDYLSATASRIISVDKNGHLGLIIHTDVGGAKYIVQCSKHCPRPAELQDDPM